MGNFYEFFAGGGMVRAGLGSDWQCLFANDFDPKKGAAYAANWGARELTVDDVRKVRAEDLPGNPDLVWGSFPCQDLSLAGSGAGLKGERSGTFYPFWDVIHGLIKDGRAPTVIAVENVCGALTSRGGKDFEAICKTFSESGYRYGALVINADIFLPQSRPRLFVIGVRKDVGIPSTLISSTPSEPFHPRGLIRAADFLPKRVRDDLIWWKVRTPQPRTQAFVDLIEDEPRGVAWHSPAETLRLLAMMSPAHRGKVDAAMRAGRRIVGGVYKRTRIDEGGRKVQRAEVRFDDTAGCLRTPAGGSSRQVILIVEGSRIRSRLISARETARLMGLDDSYLLPERYNEAYHLTGDGVAVPVVRHLAQHLFEPVLAATAQMKAA